MVGSMDSTVNSTRYITFHYVNWCQYCKLMRPIWDQVVVATKDSGIKFTELDEDVAKTPGVSNYPTIRMLDEHGHLLTYNGPADFVILRNWAVAPHVKRV